LNSLGAGENTAAVLADELFIAFSKKPKVFEVLDSQLVRSVVGQSGMDLSQCTDVVCLKSLGQKLGAEKVVSGLLTKSQGRYSLTVQMLDVHTGIIEVTQAVKAESIDEMEYEIRSIVQSLAKSLQ
jgi:TolB-like protein